MSETPAIPRIMIVEDESIVAADIEARLRELSYDVVGRTDTGEGALEMAFATKPDLVLMDVMLRGKMLGTEAAKILRHQNGLPIVFLTGNSDVKTFRSALGGTAYGYVLKPFEERELHIAIEIALDKHRSELQRESLIRQLEDALRKVKVLQELVPVCGWCKNIRDDDGYWKTVEQYVTSRFQVDITHGMCPSCFEKEMRAVREHRQQNAGGRPST